MIKRFIFSLLALLAILNVTAQSSVEEYAKRALLVGRSLQQERVYVHFDNNTYYLGETIWFKAHVTHGNRDLPTTISKVLYVELVSPEGYVVETKKYKIDENGNCNGEFELNQLLLSGYYEVRAYTRYMLNWGSEAIFSRVFPVFDKVNGNNWDFKNMLDRRRGFLENHIWQMDNRDECTLVFFPEGGNLVAGLQSRVAYELRGADGVYGKDSITITENGRIIATTVPVHNGKGDFQLCPKAGAEYIATVYMKDDDGTIQKYKFELPTVESQGAVVNITQTNDSIRILIQNNIESNEELGFAILHRGNMGFFRKLNTEKKEVVYTLDKTQLPEGVSRVTLFACDSIPLLERQFFLQHNVLQAADRRVARLNVKANKYMLHNLVAKPYEKITIVAEREDGKPINSNAEFSVSVTDVAGRQITSWDYNMYTYMLLGSELKGYIPNASSYFDKNNVKRHEQLDLVMLTHGWTSYDWSRLATMDVSRLQPVETGITLTGTLYERRAKQKNNIIESYDLIPLPFNAVRLDLVQGDSVETSVFRTDSMGRFILESPDFYGKNVTALSPELRLNHVENIGYVFALERYYSPQHRLYDYWERSLETPDVEANEKDSIIVEEINSFDFIFDGIDVVEKKKKMQYTRPPMSEIRLDYLDEWEYAQDVTYLRNTRYSDYDIDALGKMDELERLNNYDFAFYDTVLIGEDNMPFGERDRMPQFKESLTASDILRSAFKRHNLNWAYWVQLIVAKNDFSSTEIPVEDKEYLQGHDPYKMTNFREIVIRSDEKSLGLVNNSGEGFWTNKERAYKAKDPHSMFYEGFLTQMNIAPQNGYVKNEKGLYSSIDKLIRAYSDAGQVRKMRHPNYLACFIPFSEEEKTGPIIPELHARSDSRRYTMLQGYAESKKFYSPDYGSMQPDTENMDYRRTLLWDPEVKVADGKLTVDFYNSKACEAINVSIDGCAGNQYYNNDVNTVTRVDENEMTTIVMNRQNDNGEQIKEFKADEQTMAAIEQQYRYGMVYYNKRSYNNSLRIFAELAQYNFPPAYRYLAMQYKHGLGMGKNERLAAEYMEKAAVLGDSVAQYEYAVMLRDGYATAKDDKQYLHWISEAANRNEPRALAEFGTIYYNGVLVEKNVEKSIELYRMSALYGCAEGLYLYAMVLDELGRECNEPQLGNRMDCIKNSANKGYIDAQIYMMRHEDSQQNYETAYMWAKKLSMNGNSIGTTYMADCYLNGNGVKRNKSLARDLYKQAADEGSEEAARKLSEL